MFIIYLATPQFKIEVVNQTKVEGVVGKSLTLKWKLNNISENYEILSANLFFNLTRICIWNSAQQIPLVTGRGAMKFGRRILVSYKSNIYNFTLTNLQHNDVGLYLLTIAVSPGSSAIEASSSTILISKIHGG